MFQLYKAATAIWFPCYISET